MKDVSAEKVPVILVVEDEFVIAEDIRSTLQSFGYHALPAAASAQEAVSVTQQSQPDLVLMDINLRGSQTGIDAAKHIVETLHIPIIYLTSHTDHKTIGEAQLANPSGYLIKPFNDLELRINIDIALRKHATDQALRRREARWQEVVEDAQDITLIIDASGYIEHATPALTRLLGWSVNEYIGKPFVFAVHPEDATALQTIFDAAQASPQSTAAYQAEYRLMHKKGHYLWLETICRPRRNKQQQFGGIIATARFRAEGNHKLMHKQPAPYVDKITGVADAAMFYQQARVLIAAALREDKGMALLYLRLDNFIAIVEEHSLEVGHALLRHSARRLKRLTRSSDVLARLEGASFVLLLNGVTPEGVDVASQRFLKTLQGVWQVSGQAIAVQLLWSVMLMPAEGVEVQEWLEQTKNQCRPLLLHSS